MRKRKLRRPGKLNWTGNLNQWAGSESLRNRNLSIIGGPKGGSSDRRREGPENPPFSEGKSLRFGWPESLARVSSGCENFLQPLGPCGPVLGSHQSAPPWREPQPGYPRNLPGQRSCSETGRNWTRGMFSFLPLKDTAFTILAKGNILEDKFENI